ncbi:ABC transporter ATP-binding protein [Pelagibacterium halotolerans]|uniref:Lipid A export ATP-binding/permease protein MsbA n=1 Tax=Pelagibacterium halotolerans (strain DSM 22347 / JCM 15775 / CGMCC 1.7692 / B2) TaxID=1082931 RepID=G4R8S0_PELHB|nr:ABC transporter ATP-binding protein [Pelagibacterium halotolerans]AEQ50356.1 lipid A export ATP-binding/permease protein MsbA [Pelagibacterium halotolerans B2]QJR19665.1 ABC transporter ATP-binding protein [Pelagibacterium halotolerans]SEA98528.1 ATP-binding cassette, subfamily B [Pelagibacterium halotolerans]
MLRRFFSYYAPYKGLFFLDFGCAVIVGLLELSFPVVVQLYVDQLLPSQNWFWILAAAAGLLVVYILNAGLLSVVNYWGHALGIGIETDMRRQAFDHLHKLSFRYFDNKKTGHLITHVTKDLEEVGEIAHHGPEDVFIAIMTFIGAFIIMALMNLKLAALTLFIVPVAAFLIFKYGSAMTMTWKSLYGRVGDFNQRIEESIGGVRAVRAFANERHERKLFEGDNQSYRTTKLKAYKIMTASISMSYMAKSLVQLMVMLAGTALVMYGEMTYGQFVGFLLLITVLFRPIDKIISVIESYPKGIAGFKRFTDLIDTEPDIVDSPNARKVSNLRGDIVFDSVNFAYSENRPILRDITLSVKAGETIALVGPSGAGKTTICSLLPRFYEIDSGAITIDGIDIRDMTQDSLRSQIGIVQQDVFMFGTSIRDNIAYGRLGATDEEIMAAARSAQFDSVIAQLPDGLDTMIGERGVKLSGGQKQRLAIARIFLKNPPILILDEATSALDTETEMQIQRALSALSEGRTTLVIAHRLATIRNADRIAVVADGRIVEEGAHDALVAKAGAYARLHNAQFGARAAE